MKEFPRVLVISQIAFNQQTGGGVTMRNLFHGWPLDAIAQIYSSQNLELDLGVCANYLHLPSTALRILPPYISSARDRLKQTLNFLTGRQQTLGPWVHMKNLIKWSKTFSPDIIYTRPIETPLFYLWLPRQLASELNIPYVTHMFDDWPARFEISRNGLIDRLVTKPLLRYNLQLLFDHAAVNLGISAEMGMAYKKRYNREFIPFHNCVDVAYWSGFKNSYDVNDRFRIVYLGAVTEDKELYSLQDIKDVVLSLNQRDFSVSLSIYGPPHYRNTIEKHLMHSPEIAYEGFVAPEELASTVANADLLVLPINFDQESLIYTRYSLQNKVPEYMASGTPVLVYGPKTSPNIRYASQSDWAMVVDVPDKNKLEEAIIKLMSNQDLRVKLGQKAIQLAFKNHDFAIVQNRFRQLLQNVVEERG